MLFPASNFVVYETKPDNPKPDLRILDPFPEMQQYCENFPIPDDMDAHLHGHIPWLVLVMQQLKEWRASHGGEGPKNRAEQEQFRAAIRARRRNTEEENFEEAITNAFHAWVPIPIPGDVKKILADPKTDITAESRPFWITARAVKEFVANEGRGNLPVNGSIPDMTSDTKSYVALQKMYVCHCVNVLFICVQLQRQSGCGC